MWTKIQLYLKPPNLFLIIFRCKKVACRVESTLSPKPPVNRQYKDKQIFDTTKFILNKKRGCAASLVTFPVHCPRLKAFQDLFSFRQIAKIAVDTFV